MQNRNSEASETKNWPDLAAGLYDKLTGRNAEITYELQGVEIQVRDRVGGSATHTPWRIDGTLRIHTRERSEA